MVQEPVVETNCQEKAEDPNEIVRRPLSAEEVYNGAKLPRSVNSLHAALSHGNHKEVKRLIEVGDDFLITQQSPSGCTPLMLLTMGHWDESLVHKLLARRAAVESSAALRSERRRTAADYALESLTPRSPELVATLRALETEERTRTARFRCPECGDVVRRRPLLRYFWERAAKGAGEDNALLRDFFRRDEHRVLMEPWYHQVNEMRQIRKELSESLALLQALQSSLASSASAPAQKAALAVTDDNNNNNNSQHQEDKQKQEEEEEDPFKFLSKYHVVDLCCGKSLTGCLATLRYPGLAVTAVDRLEPGLMPHFAVMNDSSAQSAVASPSSSSPSSPSSSSKHFKYQKKNPNLPASEAEPAEQDDVPSHLSASEGVGGTAAPSCCDPGRMYTYHNWDVMGDSFLDQLKQRLEEVGRPTVLLGMHLCGALSLRAIEAFAALPMVSALALAPCCLPGRSEPEEVAPRSLFESKQSTAQYQAWCQHLEQRLSQAVPTANVTSNYVPEVLSPKNFVLCGVRRAA